MVVKVDLRIQEECQPQRNAGTVALLELPGLRLDRGSLGAERGALGTVETAALQIEPSV